jgi:hypothetical protein
MFKTFFFLTDSILAFIAQKINKLLRFEHDSKMSYDILSKRSSDHYWYMRGKPEKNSKYIRV